MAITEAIQIGPGVVHQSPCLHLAPSNRRDERIGILGETSSGTLRSLRARTAIFVTAMLALRRSFRRCDDLAILDLVDGNAATFQLCLGAWGKWLSI
jgi:hypothetical protein